MCTAVTGGSCRVQTPKFLNTGFCCSVAGEGPPVSVSDSEPGAVEMSESQFADGGEGQRE